MLSSYLGEHLLPDTPEAAPEPLAPASCAQRCETHEIWIKHWAAHPVTETFV
jgi:hypothetical protein